MQIDWFTLVAQIVNFIILLYLLKRFLYGRIVETMDRREQKIAARFQEAEEKRNEADQQAERYRQQRQNLKDERDKQLATAQKEVEARRKDLLDEAQQQVQQKKRGWQQALQREQDAFVQELREWMGREAGEIARRALQDLVDIELERRMADLFVAHIQELEPTTRAEISESIKESDQGIVIRSAFELPEEIQQRIVDAVQEQILDGRSMDARFEKSPDLVAGIEMQIDSYQIAWTIKDYLTGLDEQIRQNIEQETRDRHEDEHDA